MPENFKYYFISFVIAFLLLGLFIILLAALYSKKQQKNKLEKINMQSQFQQVLLQTQLEIQEQTLKTISEEIHDNVGQVLSLAKLNLFTFENTSEPKLQDTRNLVSKAIVDLRNLSHSMHGDQIAALGLIESIKKELAIIQNTGYFTTVFILEGDSFIIEPKKEMVLFRIVQEALNNTVKHSKAKNIIVKIVQEGKHVTMSISDDGIGFNTSDLHSAITGIGIMSIKKRAVLIGGELSIHSTEGNGTDVIVSFRNTDDA